MWFILLFLVFCKQKTAYEVRISDWSSDVCSSDLQGLDALDERSGVEAVDDAVIERRRQIHHRAHHDLSVLDDWSLDQLVDADNRNFRCVDHRRGDDAAERAETGDRDRRAAQFLTRGLDRKSTRLNSSH